MDIFLLHRLGASESHYSGMGLLENSDDDDAAEVNPAHGAGYNQNSDSERGVAASSAPFCRPKRTNTASVGLKRLLR